MANCSVLGSKTQQGGGRGGGHEGHLTMVGLAPPDIHTCSSLEIAKRPGPTWATSDSSWNSSALSQRCSAAGVVCCCCCGSGRAAPPPAAGSAPSAAALPGSAVPGPPAQVQGEGFRAWGCTGAGCSGSAGAAAGLSACQVPDRPNSLHSTRPAAQPGIAACRLGAGCLRRSGCRAARH